MKRYENIDEALCREMDKLDKKYAGDIDMTLQDLEMIRLLFSSMVKSDTHYAMQEEREMDEDMEGSGRRGNDGRMYSGRGGSGRSYRRGRDAMGRYTSRDMGGYSGNDGYDGYSGHYPEWMPPYPRY